MRNPARHVRAFWLVQAIVVAAVGFAATRGKASLSSAPGTAGRGAEVVRIERDLPLRFGPLYDDPELVTDGELAAVLEQVIPRFPPEKLKPNFVEHALRIWGIDATFDDPAALSGLQLRDVLIDHGRYLASWGEKMKPLLVESPTGVGVRYGKEEGGSVHHDHWLACLTEAGVPLHETIYTPSKHTRTINDALQQALRDFRVDEREVEWSAMAFGFWLPPVKSWTTQDGRIVSFDTIARRLIRGEKHLGICSGTHRLYSLTVLLRLNDEFPILSPEVCEQVFSHLTDIRQLIVASQFEDGHWPSNWDMGAAAVAKPVDDPLHKQVIATGHHLEWLALAPEELHPPREQIRRAARWAIHTTVSRSPEQILEHYTFYSHVGGALALWRHTRPADFWRAWQEANAPAAD